MTVAGLIQAWLDATGKSQTVVARAAQLSSSKLSDLKTGTESNPRWNTIERLARGFGVSTEVFLAGPRPEGKIGDARKEEPLGDVLRRHAEEVHSQVSTPGSWQADVEHAIALLARALRRSSSDETR